MQGRADNSVRRKMEELRLICDREIPIQQQRMDSAMVSFSKSLESSKAKAQEAVQNQGKLGKLKAHLRDAEDDLVKALAVKTCKEAKRLVTVDSIAATKTRVEELRRIVEDQRDRKDKYAAILSQQSEALVACEEKHDEGTEHREQIEEAISWFNKNLGFWIESGHGVKFIFSNINVKNPIEQYSFTIRHENDIYTLLDCDPHLNDTKELINELNRSNGLFKFVRSMREKFQESAACEIFPPATSIDQDSSIISVSAPVSSVSTDRSESLAKTTELQLGENNRASRKVNHGRGGKQAILSPGSASSLRRSPRFKKASVWNVISYGTTSGRDWN
ncbi:unnamed protein product [Ilex paraguariensis]|uniref:Kinetochore protein SPC25 n=1 Tax=Ilex paraguariensis TaxID=185542 RepID=A0ABC8UX33_9AQUA